MLFQCAVCGKSAGILNGNRIYPGSCTGSLEITAGKPICKECANKRSTRLNPGKLEEIAVLMQRDQFYRALVEFQPFYNPDTPEDNYIVANCLYGLKEYREALEYYNKALFLNTRSIKAWYRKGSLLFYRDQIAEAAKCFENVTALEKNYKNHWLVPARFYLMLSQIRLHNAAIMAGQESDLWPQITESMAQFYDILLSNPLFDKEMNEMETLKRVGRPGRVFDTFVDLCYARFNDIVDSLEPKIATEIRGPPFKT